MPKNVVIKPAQRTDIIEIFGRTLPRRCRAWSVFVDEELVGIAGVMQQPALMLAFSEIKRGVKVSDRTVYETALILWRKILSLGYPAMYAVASPKYPNASVFLKRLGWEHIESSARGEIYRWQIL